ncbi:hypothetical protein ERIN107935_07025 [Erysipelothrix inopinata]|uniref:hypothetical protein n=1 Tax=Erysipelothrix inopinata TaxID=225084 RepID=UPI001CB6F4E3|nr:hypothetical protein [Erysipelothrix inopinata]
MMNILNDILQAAIDGLSTDDMGCDWICDNCNAYMNNQSGFSTLNGIWTCSECGTCNDVSSDNIRNYGTQIITDNQKRYIQKIEELLGITFYGDTFEEASDFIDSNKDRYQSKLHTPHKYR